MHSPTDCSSVGTIHWGPEVVHYTWHGLNQRIGSGQPNSETHMDWQSWHDRLIELGVPEQQIPHNGTPTAYIQPTSQAEAYPPEAMATYGVQTWVLQGEDDLQPPADTPESPWEPVVPSEPPETFEPWVQPQGAHDAYAADVYVAHNDKQWLSTVPNNVWQPGVYGWAEHGSEPGPYPPIWEQPGSAEDAYAIGAHVEHHHSDRVEIYWESKIAANTTEPGADGIPPDGPWYDRYWQPLSEKPEEGVTA